MQKLKYLLLFISISVQAQIRFDSSEWNGILDQAKKNNRLVFVHAYSPWCEPCLEMEEYTFNDLEVGNFFNKNFLNVRLDMEQYPGIELADRFTIGVYPSFLFINGFGEVVHRGCGGMDAEDLLSMGKVALDDQSNLASFEKRYSRGVDSLAFLLDYLAALETSCLDAERFASNYLSNLTTAELATEKGWSIMASYQWDIYSREFMHLVNNQALYEAIVKPEAVQSKIYDTFLAQYQEVYESEELHDFGMRALLSSLNNVSFSGMDTLRLMMELHYAEFIEDWDAYATHAIEFVGMMQVDDPEELSELAWKFYLYVKNKNQLNIALGWAKDAVDQYPDPSIIDTYASLLFKLGNKRKAIELEAKALELARELNEDVEHYQYQLKRFEGKR